MKSSRIRFSKVALGMMCATFIFNSCNVDIVPEDRFVEENVWVDEENIELYVNGLYAEFKKFEFGVFPNLGYDNAMDALADGMKFTSNTAGNGTVNLIISDESRFSPASVGLNYWTSGYERIRRINEFLAGLYTKSNLSAESKARFEGEARFIRAYCYFWLAKLHGSVVILKSIDEYNTKDHPRASEEVVYDFILEDLDFASQNLPLTVLGGKASKGAALAMKARVALYAASIAKYDQKQFNSDELTGISSSKTQDYFIKSKEAAEAVIALGKYNLEDNFATVFTNKNSLESIFKVDYAAPSVVHQHDLGYAPPADALGQTLVYGVPTAELVDAFEMSDGSPFSWSNTVHKENPYKNREQRFYASILYNGATWKNRVLNTSVSDVNEGFVQFASMGDPKRTVTGYYTKKFLDPTNTTFVQNKSTQSWNEIRLAEVYLILAEANAQINDFAGSVNALNTLRIKRGVGATNYSSISIAMERIEHERIVELAFEGHRFWDLRRWRKAHIVLNNKKMTGHKITVNGMTASYEVVPVDASDRQFSTRLYYLPIPEGEVQINESLTQIKGW